jgi:hypothetical protein
MSSALEGEVEAKQLHNVPALRLCQLCYGPDVVEGARVVSSKE